MRPRTRTTHPDRFLTIREHARGGWSEIGVYINDFNSAGSRTIASVVTHPCARAKWFVYPYNGSKFSCKTREAALSAALEIARSTQEYKKLSKEA